MKKFYLFVIGILRKENNFQENENLMDSKIKGLYVAAIFLLIWISHLANDLKPQSWDFGLCS